MTRQATTNTSESYPITEIVAEIAKTELEKLNAPDATICWYDADDSANAERFLKFSELSVELQEVILKKLALCQQGKFITLKEYKNLKPKEKG